MAGMERDSKVENDGDVEDEDEEIDDTGYKAVRDAVLFVIEVSQSMLAPTAISSVKKEDKDSTVSAALKCAYALMQQRIISNPSDMMGVLLFGTEQSKFQDGEEGKGMVQYPHCYLLSDLDIPAAADIKRLRSIIEDESESQKLLVPSKEPVAMANVLFCANQIFTTRAPNFASRRLFLVTDDDDPHPQSRDLKSSSIVRAKDLYDLGVTIELFPISRPNHEFDRAKFYDDIVYRSDVVDSEAPVLASKGRQIQGGVDGISLLHSLLTSVNSRAVPKRALYSNLPLELGSALRISVKAYVLFKRQQPARQSYVWLEGEAPQIVMGKSSRVAEDSARTVEKAELRKAFKFGGETITFTPDELSNLRNFGDPIIRVVGFKERSLLPVWANLRPATFLYPSEEEYVGSTRTFSALLLSLLKRKKIGIAWYIPRKNAAPFLAALMPGEEELDEQLDQLMPPGLWLVPLPFADDIRSNPEVSRLVHAPEALIDRMRIIIQQLQLPKAIYDPSRYPNPALQWHYRILQALALEEDLPEKPEDRTVPRHRQIDKRTGAYVLDWGKLLEESYRTWEETNTGHHVHRKRAATSVSTNTVKKAKHAENRGDAHQITDEEMSVRFKKGTVSNYTVAELRDWITCKGLKASSGLKKAELVNTIEQFFETKMKVN